MILKAFSSQLFIPTIGSVFVGLNQYFSNLFPAGISNKISGSFEMTVDMSALKNPDAPSFDTLRASINLTVAAILISIATSLKLPLSTTYVTFMVTMGTSLADRAWGTDSAVYGVAGVINVIGVVVLYSLSAFLVCGGIVYLIHWGGFCCYSSDFLGVILFFDYRNFINHRKNPRNSERRLFSPQERFL